MSHAHRHRSQPDASPCDCSAEYHENTYFRVKEHITYWPKQEEARQLLEQVAARVRPVMEKKGWTRLARLAEFYPDQEEVYGATHAPTLLGEDSKALLRGYDAGSQIFVRLRRNDDRNRFLPEDDITDTLLHELCHTVFLLHDGKFLALFQHVKALYTQLEGQIYADHPTEANFVQQGFLVDMPPRYEDMPDMPPRYRAGGRSHDVAPSAAPSRAVTGLSLSSPSEPEFEWGSSRRHGSRQGRHRTRPEFEFDLGGVSRTHGSRGDNYGTSNVAPSADQDCHVQ